MAAIAPLSVSDSVPVVHTFAPVGIDQNLVATWQDRILGIALAFPTASVSLRRPTKTNRNYKLVVRMIVPTLEVTSPSTMTGINPQPTLAFTIPATFEIVLPERSTLLQRKDAFALVKNLLANVNITNAVENFESVY